MKVRVPLHGKAQGFATVENGATVGAVLGESLFWPSGALVKIEDFAPAVSGDTSRVSRTLWSLVAEIPANVSAVGNLASSGFVRRESDGSWGARALQPADMPWTAVMARLSMRV